MVVRDYKKIVDNGELARINNILKRVKDTELEQPFKSWKRKLSSGSSLKTLTTYLHNAEIFFKAVSKDIEKVRTNDIQKYLDKLAKNGQTSKADIAFSSLLSFYRHYYDLGKREYPDVFKKVEKPKKVQKDTDPLEFDEEVKKIISAWSDNPRNQSAIFVLYEAMLRKVELLSLRVKDIDLKQKPAPVNVRVSKTESGTKRRAAFIFNAIPVLKEWLNIHPMRNHEDFMNMPLFCTNKRGSPMLEGTLRTIIKEGANRAGIDKNIYPHLFRHSRAYELAQIYHFSPQELMRAGGWKNSGMLDTYYQPKTKDVKNKILNGHGIKTVTQEQREKALQKRQIRLCACGFENSYDTIFCKKCGVILNLKEYEKQVQKKDDTIEQVLERQKKLELNMMALLASIQEGKLDKNSFDEIIKQVKDI